LGKLRPLSILVFIVSLFTSCASQPYKYEPTENKMEGIGNQRGATYLIPSEKQSHGQARIASYGVVDLSEEKGMPNIRVMHIRLVATNDDKIEGWHINTQKQFLVLPNVGR